MKKFVMTAAVAAGLLGGSAANAQTVAELQAQIAALMSQMGTTSSTTTTSTSATSFKWNGTLIKKGSTGQQVKDLQNCMNALGYSTGVADGIYGSNTYKGITAFQSAKGLMVDGIVGKQTAPKFEEACAGKGTTTTTTETKFESSNGEEADVTVDNVKKADDLSNNKGDQEAFTFEVEADEQGGAAQVERVDLTLDITPKVGGEADIFDIIEKVTIEVDGKEVASMDSDDDDAWRDLTSGDEQGTIRISGVDTVVESDETVEFTVLFDIADLDEADDLDLDIVLEEVSVRYTDEAGITEEETTGAISKSTKVEALDAISFDIDENSDNPENTTVALDEDQDGVVAFVNDVTVEEQDGVLETVTVTFALDSAATASDIDDLVSDATLMFGSDEIDADEITGVGGANPTGFTVEFDMDDMDISVDDEMEVSVMLDLSELEDGSAFIGKTLEATTIAFNGEDEDGDDFTETETIDNAPELALSAGALKLEESDVEGYTEVGSDDQAAKAIFTIEVTADGDEDIRVDSVTYLLDGVSQTTALGAASANGDYSISIKDGDGDAVTAPVVINDGSTEEFTITVIYDNTGNGAGNFELEIDTVNWTEDTLGNSFASGTTTGELVLSLEAEDIDLVN